MEDLGRSMVIHHTRRGDPTWKCRLWRPLGDSHPYPIRFTVALCDTGPFGDVRIDRICLGWQLFGVLEGTGPLQAKCRVTTFAPNLTVSNP